MPRVISGSRWRQGINDRHTGAEGVIPCLRSVSLSQPVAVRGKLFIVIPSPSPQGLGTGSPSKEMRAKAPFLSRSTPTSYRRRGLIALAGKISPVTEPRARATDRPDGTKHTYPPAVSMVPCRGPSDSLKGISYSPHEYLYSWGPRITGFA